MLGDFFRIYFNKKITTTPPHPFDVMWHFKIQMPPLDMIKLERFRKVVLLLSGFSPAGVMKRSDNAGGDELLFIFHVLDGIQERGTSLLFSGMCARWSFIFYECRVSTYWSGSLCIVCGNKTIKQKHIFAYFK